MTAFALLSIAAAGCLDRDEPIEPAGITWAGAPAEIAAMTRDYVHGVDVPPELAPDPAIFDPALYREPTPYFTYPGNDDAVTVALAARVPTSSAPIDVFFTDLYWFQNFEPEWLEPLSTRDRPFLVPINDSARPLESLLHPDLLKTCQLESVLYAAPLSIRGNCLYYRADLVPSPPETWPELVEIAQKVLQSQPEGSVLKQGLAIHWQELHWDLYPMLWGYGGGPPMCLSADGDRCVPPLASDENLAALELLHRMIHSQKLVADITALERRTPEEEHELYRQFVSGRALFLIDWTNRAARIEAALAEAAREGDAPPFSIDDVGIAPIPHGPDHDRAYSMTGSWGWVMASNPRSDQSIDFIRQFTTPGAQLHFFERFAEAPIYSSETLHSLPQWPATSQRLRKYHHRLMDMVHGDDAGDRLVFRDRPRWKEVNRLVREKLAMVLTERGVGLDPNGFSRARARSILAAGDREIIGFLQRMAALGVDCDCPSQQEASPPGATP